MWKITADLVGDGKKTGTTDRKYDEANLASLVHRFRLVDDDGEVYYEGLSSDCESVRAFAPLDDFGAGYAGCTEIQYFQGGEWRKM